MDIPVNHLRLAVASDAEAISALVNSAYRGASSKQGWTTEADLLDGQRTDAAGVRELVTTAGSVVLLLSRGEDLLACVSLVRKTDRAYLGMLTVRPTRQAAGVGRELLARAEEWAAREWGTPTIEMTVIRQRAELIAWYERRGYRNTGRREAFPYNDERFGIPRRSDLEFVVLEKNLVRP